MKSIQNSIKQMLRTPVRSILFLCLMALSMCLISLGVHLRAVSDEQMQAFEEGFSTIGTVQQVPDSFETYPYWDAGLQSYSYFNFPIYDEIILLSVLDFDGANYIHPPEKRPYYGAYDYSFVICSNDENLNTEWEQNAIIEVRPLEDCVPAGPVRLKVIRVLYGKLSNDEIWFCSHNDKNPPAMLADRTYVMLVAPVPLMFVHPEHPLSSRYEPEYQINGTISSVQFDQNGDWVVDEIELVSPWEEVTEDYYETPRGRRWFELMEGFDRFRQTIPVTPTNSTNLLLAFYNSFAVISDGRDITDEEYSSGEQVCLISGAFARNNYLSVGDPLTLPLYYANYRKAAGDTFGYDGLRGGEFSYINVQGEAFPVFDSGTYRVVGIYEQYGIGFDLGWNGVIIPSASVKNSDENNIVAYDHMQAFNTSFQIPNGTIEAFMEEWNKQGITNLDIQFYDRGYTELKAGTDAIKNVSTVLLLSGVATNLLILIFFTYLFITKQKKRTAIERSLGMRKSKCGLSLLAGMMLLVLLGCIIGGVVSYLIGNTVQEQIIMLSQEQSFNTYYSNWVNNTDEKAEMEIGISAPDLNAFAYVGLIVILAAAIVAFLGIWGNLHSEPLIMLSTRKE